MRLITAASLCARGTPRRLIPTIARSAAPLFFSAISCARRTSVRSISEADMSWPFSRRLELRDVGLGFMNAASYLGRAPWGKEVAHISELGFEITENQAGCRAPACVRYPVLFFPNHAAPMAPP